MGAAAQDDTKLRKLAKAGRQPSAQPGGVVSRANDALDEGYDLFDLSNREARFALILMGGLNAALVIVASQSSLREQLSPVERQIEGSIIGRLRAASRSRFSCRRSRRSGPVNTARS